MFNNINVLQYFWSIGKFTSKINDKTTNPVKKVSDYCSYKFGNSYIFSRENIINMRLLYLCFPIYINEMEKLDWEVYKLLIKIKNRNERMFYYYLSLFFNYNDLDLNNSLNNNFYNRI